MSLACLLKMHRAAPGEVWNNGLFFSRCACCEKQLIRRRGEAWEEIPKGFKVVWKARKGGSISWRPWRPEGNGFSAPRFQQSDVPLRQAG